MQHRFLIIGQGLAGTALAWRLWERGVPFLIVDPHETITCSKVAAGLLTPITGMRLNLSWRVAELMPEAQMFYRALEDKLGVSFYHELPHVRLFKEAREIALWEKRKHLPEYQAWLAKNDPLADDAIFHNAMGGFVQKGSGWLNTALYLEASRLFFKQHECLRQGFIAESDLDLRKEGLVWQGESFSQAVLCRGWKEQQGRYFSWLPFDCARGVIARLEADISHADHRIYNRGGWLLPIGQDRWRAGSTYEFDFDRPLEESLPELQVKLNKLLKVPFRLQDAQAGMRPILKRRNAALGRHPGHPQLAVFNGLGSKGAMKSPMLSRLLVDHLLSHTPLEETLDVCSNDV